jgi:hypothetical protein
MLKILYAASNSYNAKPQLDRFLKVIEGKPFIVKIAAYKKSSPNVNIDWTLDSLLNIYKPELISSDSENFAVYYDQIKSFNPDLIISDLEYFTSAIAVDLNITLWQCSSSMINYSVTDKYNLGLFKKYAYVLNKNPVNTQRIINLIDNSNCNFVYSHFCDTTDPPELKENFEWIRPYHEIGKRYIPCRHNLVAGVLSPYSINKNLVSLISKYDDSIIFADSIDEQYSNVTLKDIINYQEYICNIYNSRLYLCQGYTSLLADAFYNQKFSIILPDYTESECLINSVFSEKLGIGKIYDKPGTIEDYTDYPVEINHNPNVKFLHERLEEL